MGRPKKPQIVSLDELVFVRTKRGKPFPHGTSNGYSNLGCRCHRCTKAWAVYYRERMHRLGRQKPLDEHLAELKARPYKHGKESGYARGCRCEKCRTASATARRERRRRQMARIKEVLHEGAFGVRAEDVQDHGA